MIYAIVTGSTVVNIIECDSAPATPPPGYPADHVAVPVPSTASGDWRAWTYSNGALVFPAASAAPTLTLAQQAAAIATIPAWKIQDILQSQPSPTNAGKTMLDDVNTLIAQQSRGVQIAWNNGADISYTSPTLAAMTQALGLTADQFNQMWISAAAIEL